MTGLYDSISKLHTLQAGAAQCQEAAGWSATTSPYTPSYD